ncbi:tRNA (guanine(26)-N(2))-dimethyltransferase-like [Centruroides sculpturatus]|uniref:tRNA (guanine(26)-N(2))-dimethyltransferase-like n=1 Tax=Centruroides sculpturatus TaxID=218467 RepID=UPI000C6E7C68|nr:tRNA (guanine(26)-N(2))-dimethyltransferase-like [Centruroides sculpturatus]
MEKDEIIISKDEVKGEEVKDNIVIDKTPSTVVEEGQAKVIFPSTNDVFYNPVQEFNRDMSIAVIKEFSKSFSLKKAENHVNDVKADNDSDFQGKLYILEALAASGLRSIRYAKEIPDVKSIVANDYSIQAVESMKTNVWLNKVEHLVSPHREEASLLMYQHRNVHRRFHVIDLDPYGSPAPFLDAAVQCVADGGLLLVTCTDMAILCGNHGETCHAKYGATSLKIKCCHEMALRIILQSIESHANRYGRYIVPLLSLSIDFYVRVFVKVYTSPNEVKKSINKLAMVYKCVGCETFHLQPLGKSQNKDKISPAHGPPVNMNCDNCGQRHQLGGPIWMSELHDRDFVKDLIKCTEEDLNCYGTSRRMIGVLNVIAEELENCPLYYTISDLCAIVHSVTPSILEVRSAILNAGYKVSLSHACKQSLKTDAPSDVIWDVVRSWVKLHPVKRDLKNTPGEVILKKEIRTEISFKLHPDANPASRLQNLCRFQVNPHPHWGPKMRAKTSLWADKQVEKQKRFQGKRKRSIEKGKDLKIYPCRKFMKGECQLGDDCRYSHKTAENASESKGT